MNTKISLNFLFFFLLSLLGMAAECQAAEYYVSPAGNDLSGGTLQQPWRTPLKAWTEAQAGDTVYFRGGTYEINSQIWTKYDGVDGTQLFPITFTRYSGEQPVFDCSNLERCLVIEKDWNIIDGINFINYITAIRFSYDLNVEGGIVKNCTATAGSGGDNSGFVYVGGAKNITIERNHITGPGLGNSGVHLNTAGIIVFGQCDNLRIRNNEIFNAPCGIYYKHGWDPASDIGVEISGNYINNVDRFSIFLNCHYANIHDNIIGGSAPSNFSIREQNGVAGGTYNIINHNTVWGGFLRLNYDGGGAISNTITNNIFRNEVGYHEYSGESHNTISNHNLFPVDNVIVENRAHYPLTAWQSHSGSDENSFSDIPVFFGGSDPVSIFDFALMADTLGENSASDGKDVGADVSLVGIQAEELIDTTAPDTPSGLSVY